MSCSLFSSVRRMVLQDFYIASVRRYVKPLIRKPIAVLSNEESNDFHKKGSKVPAFEGKGKKQLDNRLSYINLKDGDERFGQFLNGVHSGRNKNVKNSKIILEGVRLIADAINKDLDIKRIYFTKTTLLNMIPMEQLTSATEFYKVSEKEMKIWSDTSHSSGLLAIATQPKIPALFNPILPVKIILDGIKDEGHVGTLIRSAAAVGVEKVFVTNCTVDPWKPKVLRAAMGGHFHIPVASANSQFLEGYVSNSSALYVMSLDQEESSNSQNQKVLRQLKTITYDQMEFRKNSVLMIGSEESQNFIENSSHPNAYHIVSSPYFDSFNPAVDGSVILFEMKRQYDSTL